MKTTWHVRVQRRMVDDWGVIVLTRWRCVALAAAWFWWAFRSTEWSALLVESRDG